MRSSTQRADIRSLRQVSIALTATVLSVGLTFGLGRAFSVAGENSMDVPDVCDESLGLGRVVRDGDDCVLLNSIIVKVANGYTVDQAADALEQLAGWTVVFRMHEVRMVSARHVPDTLTLAQLDAQRAEIEALAWAESVERDAMVTVLGEESDSDSSGSDSSGSDSSGSDSSGSDSSDSDSSDSDSSDSDSSGSDSGGGQSRPEVAYPRGFLENPGRNSFQSGIGVISGWVCEAQRIEVSFDDDETNVWPAAYGTTRSDTQEVCGDDGRNGFGLLFNWNLLGDGEHAITVRVDGVAFARVTFTVTTLGEEFVWGAPGECLVEDFPSRGEAVRLEWQQSQQNFMIVPLVP